MSNGSFFIPLQIINDTEDEPDATFFHQIYKCSMTERAKELFSQHRIEMKQRALEGKTFKTNVPKECLEAYIDFLKSKKFKTVVDKDKCVVEVFFDELYHDTQ